MSMKRLMAYKCENCGQKTCIKYSVCPNCRKRDISNFEIDGPGTVITYTKLYAVPKGIDEMPLILGIIKFNGGIQVTGQLVNEEVKVGDKVRAVWGKLRTSQGKDIYGFKFELIK